MIKSRTDKLFDRVNCTILTIVAVITLFPVYYVAVLSVTNQREYIKGGLILYPKAFTLENFQYILSSSSIPRAGLISLYLATFGTLLSLAVTSLLAYSISRKRLMGKTPLLIMILFTMLFNPGMIPPYLLIRNLHLIDNLWALILPALSSGWNVFLMKGFFENIPESLEEAAIIDGCSDFKTFTKIIAPLSLPAFATFGLFFAVAYWNTFFNALLYINSAKLWPLQLVLRQMLTVTETNPDSNLLVNPEVFKMAAVVISIIPIAAVYPFLQKHFAKGVMVGSVKG